MIRFQLGLVLWEDAAMVPDDEDPKTVIEARPGFIVEETDKQVVVASGLFNDGSVRDRIVIPRAMVRRVLRLGKVRV